MVAHHGLTLDFARYYSQGIIEHPNVSGLDLDDYNNLKYWRFSTDSMKYQYMVRSFVEKFGAENVLVCTFEELAQGKVDIARRIASFMGDAMLARKIQDFPHLNVRESDLVIILVRLYFRIFSRSGIVVTSQYRGRCKLDCFAEHLTFWDAARMLRIHWVPKLLISRIYKKRLLFCSVTPVRKLSRLISQFIPWTKKSVTEEDYKTLANNK